MIEREIPQCQEQHGGDQFFVITSEEGNLPEYYKDPNMLFHEVILISPIIYHECLIII